MSVYSDMAALTMNQLTRNVSTILVALSLSASHVTTLVQSANAKLSDYDPTDRNSKVRKGVAEVDPTASNSTAGKALTQADPTNPNSAVRGGLRQLDPSTPTSALRKGVRQADPTDPNSTAGKIVDNVNPASVVGRSANKELATAGQTYQNQFLDPTKQLLMWAGGGILALLIAARLLRGKRA